MKLITGRPVLAPQDESAPYRYLYIIPDSVDQSRPQYIQLCLHGSNSVDIETGTYPSKTYPEQIQEFLVSYREEFKAACSGTYITLYIFRPRDCESTSYPDSLRDAQAFTKEVMADQYIAERHDSIYSRPDLKVLQTLDVFTGHLRHNGYTVRDSVLLQGGSAGALAANTMAVLHPDRVKAVAVFSAGMFLYPESTWTGQILEYPMGLAGIRISESWTFAALKKIPHTILVGEHDVNDPSAYLLYGKEDRIPFANAVFGATPVHRAVRYAEYLREYGITVNMEIVKGSGHSLPKPYVWRIINAAFCSAVNASEER